jgi:hypothetical protein
VDSRQPHAALAAYADVGHHRIDETARDDAHRALDRLIRADELRRAAPLERQLLDEGDVDVGADAEREHAAIAALSRRARRDLRRVAQADRRLAVGHEQHEGQPLP